MKIFILSINHAEQLVPLKDEYRQIQIQANMAINSGRPDWFEKLLSSISEKAGISYSDVESFWKEEVFFTTTLQYVHLGSPDKIFIREDDGNNVMTTVEGTEKEPLDTALSVSPV